MPCFPVVRYPLNLTQSPGQGPTQTPPLPPIEEEEEELRLERVTTVSGFRWRLWKKGSVVLVSDKEQGIQQCGLLQKKGVVAEQDMFKNLMHGLLWCDHARTRGYVIRGGHPSKGTLELGGGSKLCNWPQVDLNHCCLPTMTFSLVAADDFRCGHKKKQLGLEQKHFDQMSVFYAYE
ncbi:hypothetical protein OPV22_023121 [Ensete ventricosum]|uniref:Uncharacterized protein n=1 Tax=Ensete ventricosum TaxID=4639 RepID=A0AAV8QVY7_ENSVE|nr:hypothetical protein OPV22_023121 [Ensete ventricosum]